MEGSSPDRRASLKRLGLVIGLTVVVVAAIVGLALTMAVMHDRSMAADITQLDQPVPAGIPYHVDVLVKIVAVDLNKETVGIQLEVVPKGKSLVEPLSGNLKNALLVKTGVSASGIGQTKVIPAGDPGGIMTVDLDLDGNVEEYPWDRHTTTLWVSVWRQAKGLDPEPQYVRLQGYGAWPGLHVDLTPGASPDWDLGGDSPWELKVAMSRSTVTSVVVYFSILLTWVLIASVVGMTLAVLFGGRKTEISMVAFFTTLLFAMTAFRNALPGAPPMGAASDYLAFFWGFAVAIVAVGVMSVVWLLRREQKDKPPAQ